MKVRDDLLMQDCAYVYVRRLMGVDCLERGPETVDRAVADFSSISAFKKWAKWYGAEGMGIAG